MILTRQRASMNPGLLCQSRPSQPLYQSRIRRSDTINAHNIQRKFYTVLNRYVCGWYIVVDVKCRCDHASTHGQCPDLSIQQTMSICVFVDLLQDFLWYVALLPLKKKELVLLRRVGGPKMSLTISFASQLYKSW